MEKRFTFLQRPIETFHLVFPLIGRQVQFRKSHNLQSGKELLRRAESKPNPFGMGKETFVMSGEIMK